MKAVISNTKVENNSEIQFPRVMGSESKLEMILIAARPILQSMLDDSSGYGRDSSLTIKIITD